MAGAAAGRIASMIGAPRVFWEAVRAFVDEMFLLVLMNLVTVFLMIPVVTFPPALAGLWNVGNCVADGLAIRWSDYVEGFRRCFWKAWGLTLLNVLVIAVSLTNVYFYSPRVVPFRIDPDLARVVQVFFFFLLGLWLIYQLYPLAMLLELEQPRLRTALRNSAAVLVLNPGFTLVLALPVLIVDVITVYLLPSLFLITFSFNAVVCNKAVKHLLRPFRERAREEGGEEEEQAG